MRWLVEVTSLGTTEKESLHVEAETWQKALHAARSLRGEPGPMSGFSIELLDEGCRAVDPSSRTKYEVRRAADQTGPVIAPPAEPPAHAPAHAPTPPRAPAPAAAAAPAASTPPRPAGQPPASFKQTMMMGSAPLAPVAPAAPLAPTPATLRADVAANVPSQIVFKREQDATEAMPLTYREYVYNVPPGTTEGAAETLLVTQLEFVRASLEKVPAGKLVNLAAVDSPVDAKPATPPIATLAWKDWRGAPVVSFPRRPASAKRVLSHSRPPAPSFGAPLGAAPIAPLAPAVPVIAPAAAAPPAIAPVAAPPPALAAHAPVPAPVFAPPAAAGFAAPAANPFMQPPPPAFAAPAPEPVVAPLPPSVRPPPPAVQAPPPTAPRAPSSPNGRVRGEDLIADLFEAMHDLHFLRDAVEGGDFCLALAMEKLPSQAGIVHLYDIDRREFLITSTRGTGTGALLAQRFPENEAILAAAMRKRRPLVFADAVQSEAAAIERYVALGGARSVIVAPVMREGRFLGALELLNPLDGQPFTESEGNAVMYIADQLAEFVGERGIVTDPERIAPRPAPGA